jgi:hypothetical protein
LGRQVGEHAGEDSAPAILGRAAYEGAKRLLEICSERLDPEDVKQRRLVVDMSAIALKLQIRVSQGEYKARRDGAMAQLLAQVAEEAREHDA